MGFPPNGPMVATTFGAQPVIGNPEQADAYKTWLATRLKYEQWRMGTGLCYASMALMALALGLPLTALL